MRCVWRRMCCRARDCQPSGDPLHGRPNDTTWHSECTPNGHECNTIDHLRGGGAATLTAVHQAAQRTVPHAPRVDVTGRPAIAKSLSEAGVRPPRGKRLDNAALAGDLVSNAAYYAMLGLSSRRHLWRNATLLSLAAG